MAALGLEIGKIFPYLIFFIECLNKCNVVAQWNIFKPKETKELPSMKIYSRIDNVKDVFVVL